MSNKASKKHSSGKPRFLTEDKEKSWRELPLGPKRKLERVLGRNCRLHPWAVSGIWLMLILLYVQVSVVHPRVVFTGRLDWRWREQTWLSLIIVCFFHYWELVLVLRARRGGNVCK